MKFPNSIKNVHLDLYRMDGIFIKNLMRQSNFGIGEFSINLDTSGLQSGVYVVRLQTENGVVARKFIKL